MTQERMQELVEKKENGTITPEEEVELLAAVNDAVESLRKTINEGASLEA